MTCGKDMPLQKHQKSTTKNYDDKGETIAFYKELLEKNSEVKRQFERLISKSPYYGDPHFGHDHDEPTIVEWIPTSVRGRIQEGYSTDEHLLVFESVSFTRPPFEETEVVIVSEFHVVQVDKEHAVEGEKGPSAVDSDEITITFLGFRDIQLTPIKPAKAKQPGAGQPAAKPADKVPAEAKPPTTTSKDGHQ